jgi:hypothetical protein
MKAKIEQQDKLFKEILQQQNVSYKVSQMIVSKGNSSASKQTQKKICNIIEFIAENGGSTRNLSKFKIMKLMEHLDFMVQLSENERKGYR